MRNNDPIETLAYLTWVVNVIVSYSSFKETDTNIIILIQSTQIGLQNFLPTDDPGTEKEDFEVATAISQIDTN